MAEEPDTGVELKGRELREVERRSAIGAHVVHEAIRLEGEEELIRPSSALFWSGLAAGLSMGLSVIAEGVLRANLPEASWRPLVAKIGYSFGFVVVILGRQQLFTENTLTPILPLLHSKRMDTLLHVLRLWFVVLAANLLGASIFAWVAGNSAAFSPHVRHAFLEIGRETMAVSFGDAVLRGVFAGWIIALVVWLLPFADVGRVAVIVGLTWLVAAGGFTHIIAGSIEALYVVAVGEASWLRYAGGYMVPTLIGNTLGGVSLVAAINHAQVVSGRKRNL